MPEKYIVRALIVGASSALGKELAEQINQQEPSWDLTLADSGEAGQITSAGDEAMVIAPLEDEVLASADIVFFAGDASTTSEHWQKAKAAGAAIVDLTGALDGLDGVVVSAPSLQAGKPDLATIAIVPAHPAALMLGAIVLRLRSLNIQHMVATVLEPASQQGHAGMDELHKQTVALLSFQTLPKEVYDAQIAFTVRDSFGPSAQRSLSAAAEGVRRHLKAVAGESPRCSLQLLQVPVFHGYTASVWLDAAPGITEQQLRDSLDGAGLKLAGSQEDEVEDVNNQDSSGQPDILLRLHADEGQQGFWLWVAADNLNLTARNAIACASELLALRPSRTLQ